MSCNGCRHCQRREDYPWLARCLAGRFRGLRMAGDPIHCTRRAS